MKIEGSEAAPSSGDTRIIDAPRNCWRIARTDRAAFLIDAASYFFQLNQALRRARRSILIVGWDFDGKITLERNGQSDVPAKSLRNILIDLVEAKPELEIHVLIWDASVFYAPSTITSYFEEKRYSHPRIHFKFDSEHPVEGCNHEKIVCIDNGLAFLGGMDLTVRRWDTSSHEVDDPRRLDPDGKSYRPVHDIQIAVDGAAAAAVCELARNRWRHATGEELPCIESHDDPWPETMAPALRDVPVAIARTRPPSYSVKAIREIEALTLDALAAAEKWIYIEAQYLSNFHVAEVLTRLLEKPTGPEIVAVVRYQSDGWIEQLVMASNRDRLLRRLQAVDHYGRFRAYYPIVPGPPEQDISIHSKLIIVDGRFVKIGSSNLNNRSMGLDTECDVAIEAETDETRRAIIGLRDRLLAEHLGVGVEAVEAAARRCRSLVDTVETLNTGARGLRLHEPSEGSDEPLLGTALLDPDEPIDLNYLWRG